ncbi:MAG: VCBS repeat-containing protein [Chitinophagales bacterium]
MLSFKHIAGWIVLLLLLSGCQKKRQEANTLFVGLNESTTGVEFSNTISETEAKNYFTYPYLYMGGGVAIGDLNNDGLQDLYFTSNMEENKLYLNQTSNKGGHLQFKDITQSAGVTGNERWDTGVAMADVNGDGFLDIYVSISGKWSSTANLLFVNNGDLTFTEKAAELGLADTGNSTQATFFDYDRDGDLDVYVANYPPLHFKSPNFVYSQNARNPRPETSDHLYRNDGGVFTDVTSDAGVLNFGLSLSATAGDFNNDGWQDIYVSNDFAAPDYLYMNNQDGTFSDKISQSTAHTAYYGMGTDVADFNNDGLLDIFQVDMTPEDNFRSKANMASMNPEGFKEMIDLGLTYQYMENALQLNHGITANGLPRFGDVSRMTGTALSDWSWSPLFADLDNDGWKDIHITNGTRRDINNKDFFNALENNAGASDLEKSQSIPSQRIDNYVFKNQGNLTFKKNNQEWGLSFEGFSNGSAYGDLDNDGDLDLVTNNIDDPASIFENQGNSNNWLRVAFVGPKGNRFGLGTRAEIHIGGRLQVAENTVTRGFQSASEPILHFGLGNAQKIDKLKVTWFDGKTQIFESLEVNQLLTVTYSEASFPSNEVATVAPYFSVEKDSGVAFKHQENTSNDFAKERLLPHATSQFGPGLAVGDANKDGLSDFYIGGASGQSGALFLQQKEGGFEKSASMPFEADKKYEDLGALFFDANGDGWEDLYVVSGGNEEQPGSEFYNDRLYLNNRSVWTKSSGVLPEVNSSGSRVKAFDFDGDGDLDLLVGGRLVPKTYGQAAKTFLLLNQQQDGKTFFEDVTIERAPEMEQLGMVTDFVWTDFDQDGATDIVVVGEWMPVCFFKNDKGHFTNVTAELAGTQTRGWWFSIAASDLNQDGKDDLILGNLGKNYKYQASEEATFDLYVSDYDKNDERDIVLSYHHEGEQFPVRGRQCSSEQMPEIKQKFKSYNEFAAASLADVYSEKALNQSEIHFSVNSFASQIWLSDTTGKFIRNELPAICQISSVNVVLVEDIDKDGYQDLLLGGNLFTSEVETKRNDASIGQYLRGNGKGQFTVIPYTESGLMMPKDVKDMAIVLTPRNRLLIVANNDDDLKILNF